MAPVKMYTTMVCPFCVRAKMLLKQRGVEQIEEIRVDLNPAERQVKDAEIALISGSSRARRNWLLCSPLRSNCRPQGWACGAISSMPICVPPPRTWRIQRTRAMLQLCPGLSWMPSSSPACSWLGTSLGQLRQ